MRVVWFILMLPCALATGLAASRHNESGMALVVFFVGLTLWLGWLAFRPRRAAPDIPLREGEIIAHGSGGSMRFDGREVIISRHGGASLMIHGAAGEKTIILSAIQAVQLRKPRAGSPGFLQLALLGADDARGGVINAAVDENSVLFDLDAAPAFTAMAEAIKAALHDRAEAAAPHSVADELAKFATLRDQGILTEAEFAARKARLLE